MSPFAPMFINILFIYCGIMAAMEASTEQELHAALEASLHYGPSYERAGLSLSSHLPMVLTALWRLEAPAAALERQLALWAQRLPAAAPRDTAAAPARLHELLPRMLAAPETAAFHDAIRVAYALESGHDAELAAALASYVAGRRTLGPLPPFAREPRPLREVVERARREPTLAMAPRNNTTIMSDMAAAQELPGFAVLVALAQPTLDELAEASLAVYLATHDFTALHLVTGCHAVRVLLCHAPELDRDGEGQVLRALWRAWLAAYVAIGKPAPDWDAVHGGSASEGDWRAALPALHASINDHRIKLADAARQEWRLRGWPGYARCLEAQGAAR